MVKQSCQNSFLSTDGKKKVTIDPIGPNISEKLRELFSYVIENIKMSNTIQSTVKTA